MKLSQRVLSAAESQTLAISAKAKAMRAQGVAVVNLSAGEPDFPTPQVIKEAAVKALEEDFTHYTDVRGILPLRQVVAEKFCCENGIEGATPDTVLITAGAKHAIFSALLAICNEGDEVLIPAPYWVSYPSMARIAGAVPKVLPAAEAHGWKITPKQLHSAITERTKCLILNSPSNPTGVMYSPDELRALAEVIKQHELFVISDEIYEKIVFDPYKKHFSIGSIPEIASKVITVNGVSKAYAMTGWRIGYVTATKAVIDQMKKIIGQSITHATSFAQKAAVVALERAGAEVERMRQAFLQRRNLIVQLLQQIPNLSFPVPEGAFYVFVNLSHYLEPVGWSAEQFAHFLLEKYFVATVPGEAFGQAGCIRISYATSEEQIRQGVERLRQALLELPSHTHGEGSG